MTIVFYGQNTTVGVLRHATGRFPLCSVLLVLSYCSCINKVIQRILLHLTLKVISKGLGLAVTVCGTKGVFTPLKKASCPGYGARRPLKWKNKNRVILPYIASFCGFIVILL